VRVRKLFEKSEREAGKSELIVSYLFLRQTVGWIGGLLPVALIASSLITAASPWPDSMSGYYYTDMRNVFVGALCALGVFLVAYNGYDDVDRWITNVAGLGAIGVAFCPAKPSVCAAHARVCAAPAVRQLSTGQQVAGDIHLVFAALTFVALGVMALRFAMGQKTPAGLHGWALLKYGLGLAKGQTLRGLVTRLQRAGPPRRPAGPPAGPCRSRRRARHQLQHEAGPAGQQLAAVVTCEPAWPAAAADSRPVPSTGRVSADGCSASCRIWWVTGAVAVPVI
jgi:hypothetical protein